MHKYFFFLFVVILLFPARVTAQNNYNPAKKFAANELAEDVLFFSKAITQNHPEFYISQEKDSISLARNKKNYTKAVVFANLISRHITSVSKKDSLTEAEFLQSLSFFNSIIQCVHTDIRPSAEFDKWWKKEALLVPFNVFYKNGDLFIYQNYGDNPLLKKGTKIHAINGVKTSQINTVLRSCIASDGNNNTRKDYALRRGFYRYHSYYIYPSFPKYTITITPFGANEKQTITVKGITKSALDERRNLLEKNSQKPPINLSFIDSLSTALLSIPTFRNDLFEAAGIQFSEYLDSVFSLLKNKNTKRLIVDLRGNGGGYSEYGAQLLTYLSNRPFEYCRNMWLSSDTLRQDVKYDIPETFDGFPNGIEKAGGNYKWTKHSVLGWRKPSKNHFKGHIFFLIDGGCVSTTSEVASIAKENHMGLFIGEEAGGKYAGDNGGVLGWVELPNTKIRVRIALVEYELAVTFNNNGRGVYSDYLVQKTIEDIVYEKDKDLELAITLIKNQK